MIPNATDLVEVTGNIDSESTGEFTVDVHSLTKIMGILTNLYSDPEGAVVREYLTNALDSQIEAQAADPNYVWRPIEVTTPSHFSKEYVVRDFGVGMSVDDIKDIYSKYGKSTKEHTNDATGMLGLGSKCALTYTGQFTITGFKNGVRCRALISKNDSGTPVFMIVDTRATDEPNGVEISVPVRDRNTFEEKTAHFLKFWKDGQVLVNGKEPAKHGYMFIQNSAITYKVANQTVHGTAQVYLAEKPADQWRSEAPTSYVVMGNVPYSVDSTYVNEALRDASLGFVAFVPMGAVAFPPSREELMYNAGTKSTVEQVSKGLYESILNEKLKEITDAPDHRTAWTKHAALPYYFARHPKATSLTYKGLAFPDRVQQNHMMLDWDWKGNGNIAERQWMNLSSVMASGRLVVTGVTMGTKPSSYFKKKVRHYMNAENLSVNEALLVDTDIDNVWMDWMPRIDAETIKAIKLPRGASVGPRAEVPFEHYRMNGTNVESGSDVQVPIDAGQTMVYISPQDMRETYRKSGTSPDNLMKWLGKDYVLVVLGKNRFDKFLRTYPNAITAAKAVQDRIDAWVAATTDAEYLVGKLEFGEKEFFTAVDTAKLNDPELVALAQVVQSKGNANNYAQAEQLHLFSRRCEIVTKLPDKKNVKNNVAKRYPLIGHLGKRQMNHLLIYCNAVYDQLYAQKP